MNRLLVNAKEKYHLYILYSDSIDQYYIGISSDPSKRLYYHNSGNKGWTRRGRPWELKFVSESMPKNEALKRERWLKSQKSKVITQEIINGDSRLGV